MSLHHEKHNRDHHQSADSVDERTDYVKKHHHKLVRNQLIKLNNYFEKTQYLRSDPEKNSTFVEMLIDLYDEMENRELRKDLSDFFAPNFLMAFQTGYDKLFLINAILEETRTLTKFRKLPLQVAETVSTFIELLDLVKLPSIATVHNINLLLDKLRLRLENFDDLPFNTIINDIKSWEIKNLKPGIVEKILLREHIKLSEAECRKLEIDISIWFDKFILELSKL